MKVEILNTNTKCIPVCSGVKYNTSEWIKIPSTYFRSATFARFYQKFRSSRYFWMKLCHLSFDPFRKSKVLSKEILNKHNKWINTNSPNKNSKNSWNFLSLCVLQSINEREDLCAEDLAFTYIRTAIPLVMEIRKLGCICP